MESINSELIEAVKVLLSEFQQKANDEIYNFMHSNPEYSNFLNQMVDIYLKASQACQQFLHNHNLRQLILELTTIGFYTQVISLKEYTQDLDILEEIKVAEREYQEFSFTE